MQVINEKKLILHYENPCRMHENLTAFMSSEFSGINAIPTGEWALCFCSRKLHQPSSVAEKQSAKWRQPSSVPPKMSTSLLFPRRNPTSIFISAVLFLSDVRKRLVDENNCVASQTSGRYRRKWWENTWNLGTRVILKNFRSPSKINEIAPNFQGLFNEIQKTQ